MTLNSVASLVKFVGAAMVLVPCAGRALAQAAPPAKSVPVVPTVSEGLPALSAEPPLLITITPYLWMPSLSGDMSLKGTDINVDASFSDIVEKAGSVYGLMGAVDLEYGRALFQFNGTFMHVGIDEQHGHAGAAQVDVSADLNTDIGWYEFTSGWRFVDKTMDGMDNRHFRLDGLLGARLTTFNASTNITSAVDVTLPDGSLLQAGVSREFTNNEDWVELFVGGRMLVDLSEHWTLGLRGDIGGFGLGPDQLAWQGAGYFAYRFPMGDIQGAVVLGYRALSQDFENNGATWDVIAHGPAIGFAFIF